MTVFGHDLNIKSVGALFGQRINRSNQAGEMQRGGRGLVSAQLAVKVPKINTGRQSAGALAFDVRANVVFGRVQQAFAVFAFNLQRIRLFHGLPTSSVLQRFVKGLARW